MKMRGGYLPRIAGRPESAVLEAPLPGTLFLDLQRHGLLYRPVVTEGQNVMFGARLAEADVDGGCLGLPAPAGGKVAVRTAQDGTPERIILDVQDSGPPVAGEPPAAGSLSPDATCHHLAANGIWPLLWSHQAQGMPVLDPLQRPASIIVKCVIAEPFRARGHVILKRSWDAIGVGLKSLAGLLVDGGAVEVVLTRSDTQLGQRVINELSVAGQIKCRVLPLLYPVEHPALLTAALRRNGRAKADGDTWVLDVQTVAAIGACIRDGLPLHERVITVGGPACAKPRHVAIRIGAPLLDVPGTDSVDVGALTLRGGLLTGEPVDRETEAVRDDDDGFFLLPPPAAEREFLSFVRVGFDRVSALPCFASALTGAPDRSITGTLRGETRPCIACGLCEKLCPADLMPQVLHRYLYAEQLDEAEATGLERCIDCNLCTFVCPSKIELQKEFAAARAQIRREHEEIAAAAQKHAAARAAQPESEAAAP